MDLMNFPILALVLSFVIMFLAAECGNFLRTRLHPLKEEDREDFRVVVGATLTLLGLLIGFTFSMAVSRYDQRKNYEEAKANAIGTEYLRADLLPVEDATKVRQLLKAYLDQRILFYTTRSRDELPGSGQKGPNCRTSFGLLSARAPRTKIRCLRWPSQA